MKEYLEIEEKINFSPEYFDDDELVIITEKVDGYQLGFKMSNETLIFRSNDTVFNSVQNISDYPEELRAAIQYIRKTLDMEKLAEVTSDESLVFFGEVLYENNTMYNTWDGQHPDVDESFPNFLGFDVFDENKEIFLPFKESSDYFELVGLKTVPTVEQVTGKYLSSADWCIPRSKIRHPDPDIDEEYDRIGYAEGVVFRSEETNKRIKLTYESYNNSRN